MVLVCALVGAMAASNSGSAGVPTPVAAADPSIIWDAESSLYHVFATGAGLHHLTSPDLVNWSGPTTILDSGVLAPAAAIAWVTAQCPEICALVGPNCGVTNVWAPDISYFNGLFHL